VTEFSQDVHDRDRQGPADERIQSKTIHYVQVVSFGRYHYELLGKAKGDHRRAMKIFKILFFNKFPSGGNIFKFVSPSIIKALRHLLWV